MVFYKKGIVVFHYSPIAINKERGNCNGVVVKKKKKWVKREDNKYFFSYFMKVYTVGWKIIYMSIYYWVFMAKIQEIKRPGGTTVNLIYLPKSEVEAAGFRKGDEVLIEAKEKGKLEVTKQ